MATCSSILAWKISWTEETAGLQSMAECLMNYGQRFVTLYRRQGEDDPQEKEMQKSKMAVSGGLTNICVFELFRE